MLIFLYTIVFIILLLLIFSFIAEKTYYVNSRGQISPADKASTIKNLVTGKVTEVNISNGSSVKKGDVLFKIDTAITKQTIAALLDKGDMCKAAIEFLTIFKRSISANENLFKQCDSNKNKYQIRYEKYVNDIAASILQYQNNILDIAEIKNDITSIYCKASDQLIMLNFDLTQIDYLIASINNSMCSFPNMNANSLFPKKYQEYITDIEKYTQAIKAFTDIKDSIGKSYIIGEEKKAKYINSQDNLNAYQAELKKYKYDYLLLIQQRRDQLVRFIDDISISIQHLKSFMNENFEKSIVEKIKLETLLAIYAEITLQQQDLYTINMDINQLTFNLLNAQVISPIDGQINMCTEIKQSDYLQSGLDIATILPIYKVKYKVLIDISSSDICKIRVNQKIILQISSLPMRDSEFYGTIMDICSETKTDIAAGCTYYVAECMLNNDSIKSFEKLFNTSINSIDCGAKIITKQCKIFYWLLEKLKLVRN